MRLRTARYVALTLAIPLVLGLVAGCGGGADEGAPAGEAEAPETGAEAGEAAEADAGDEGKTTLYVALPNDIVEVDPHRTLWSSDSSVHFALYDSLIQRDDQMNFVGVLAEEWENVSPTEWVFHLREGVKFHNGEPFNAYTVVWNVGRGVSTDEKRDPMFKHLAGAEAIDEHTVKITTKEPYPLVPQLMVRFYMLPPGYYQEVGYDEFVKNPVGTGPYKWVERVRDSHIVLERNEDYFRGAAAFEKVIFKVIPDSATRVAALKAGEVDLVDKLPPDQVQTVESSPELEVLGVESDRIAWVTFYPDSPQGGGEPLKNKKVRQAINYAVNIDNYIEYILDGHSYRISTVLSPMTFAYDEDLEPYPYDPEKAKQLLEEAGYGDGFTINMDTPASFVVPKTVDTAQAIAADLEKVGITVNVRPVEFSAIITLRDEREIAPMFVWSWGSDYLDPDRYFTPTVYSENPWSFWSDPRMDELVEAAQKTMDQEERARIYKELQALVKEEAPGIFLYTNEDLYGVSKEIEFTPRSDERIMVYHIQPAD